MHYLLLTMPRTAKEDMTQVAIRLPTDWVDRAEELVDWIARPGVGTTRTDVLRAALIRGLEALEADRKKTGK